MRGGGFFFSRPCSEGTCDAKGKRVSLAAFPVSGQKIAKSICSIQARVIAVIPKPITAPAGRLWNRSKHLCVLAALGANLWQTSKDG